MCQAPTGILAGVLQTQRPEGASLFPKPTREKDAKYLAWIRTLPCVVPLCTNTAQAHHVDSVGSGGSDRRTVPLCAAHHTGPRSVHMMGVRTFQEYHDISFDEKVDRLNMIYDKKNNA